MFLHMDRKRDCRERKSLQRQREKGDGKRKKVEKTKKRVNEKDILIPLFPFFFLSLTHTVCYNKFKTRKALNAELHYICGTAILTLTPVFALLVRFLDSLTSPPTTPPLSHLCFLVSPKLYFAQDENEASYLHSTMEHWVFLLFFLQKRVDI